MNRIVFAVCAAFLFACDYTPDAIGKEDTLLILASPEDRVHLEPLLESIFDDSLETPQPEPYYNLQWADPQEFEKYNRFKNVIVASLANPVDSTGDKLVAGIFGKEPYAAAMAGGNPIYLLNDFYAKGQILLGILALDAIQAGAELKRLKPWINQRFEEQILLRQAKVVYRNGEHPELSDTLQLAYGWHMRLQPDFKLIREKPAKNFVWLGRGYPYRWLSVYWIEQADTIHLSSDWVWERMDYIAQNLYGTIFIDTLFNKDALGDANGHNLRILRGVWAQKQETGGGPFTTYVFRDREQNRIYFLTAIVFNPGGEKLTIMRRLEVIMRTFHTFLTEPQAAPESKNRDSNYT